MLLGCVIAKQGILIVLATRMVFFEGSAELVFVQAR